MKLLALALFIALTIAGCQSANVAFNEHYEGDDFMVNYEYSDGNVREDLLGNWFLVRAEEHWNGRDEIIKGGPYEGEVECLLQLHHKYEPDDGYICTVLK